MVKLNGTTIPTQGSGPVIVSQTIDTLAVRTAQENLQKYMAARANLDERIIDNEDWYKLQHWRQFHRREDPDDRIERQTSAWLFNSLSNKHADAMDNFPEPAVLPRSVDDEDTAKQLSSVLPVIFDNCDFEQAYSDNWWDKLKNGTAVYSVLWDATLNDGQGDVSIRPVDILQFYWEPGVKDIQDSENIFVLALQSNSTLEKQYPELQGKLSGSAISRSEYHYDDTVDTTGKSVVVDWYYKVQTESGTLVHYVKYCGDTVLFASENETGYENGIYDHGDYPFVMDTLFTEKGTPAGFGFIDVMRSPQEYIDRLGTALLLNAEEGSQRRYALKDTAGVNEDELKDIHQRIIHCTGSPNEDNFRELQPVALSSVYVTIHQDKINELKETSGNRDFNQGGTNSGVTAASAIQALQENGNKISRDMIKGAYRCYTQICKMTIELIRQFYDIKRVFRITGEDGNFTFTEFDNSAMQEGVTEIAGEIFRTKAPVFDIKISAQKQNPYSKLSQNELALQLFSAGFFNPQLALQVLPTIDMMDFDGKDKVRQAVQQNAAVYQQLQQLQQLVVMSAQALAAKGDNRVLQAVQSMGLAQTQQQPQGGTVNMEAVNDKSDNP